MDKFNSYIWALNCFAWAILSLQSGNWWISPFQVFLGIYIISDFYNKE